MSTNFECSFIDLDPVPKDHVSCVPLTSQEPCKECLSREGAAFCYLSKLDFFTKATLDMKVATFNTLIHLCFLKLGCVQIK